MQRDDKKEATSEEEGWPRKKYVPKSWSDKPKRKAPVHEIDFTDPYLSEEDIFDE